jgi:hypothetical protein
LSKTGCRGTGSRTVLVRPSRLLRRTSPWLRSPLGRSRRPCRRINVTVAHGPSFDRSERLRVPPVRSSPRRPGCRNVTRLRAGDGHIASGSVRLPFCGSSDAAPARPTRRGRRSTVRPRVFGGGWSPTPAPCGEVRDRLSGQEARCRQVRGLGRDGPSRAGVRAPIGASGGRERGPSRSCRPFRPSAPGRRSVRVRKSTSKTKATGAPHLHSGSPHPPAIETPRGPVLRRRSVLDSSKKRWNAAEAEYRSLRSLDVTS